MVVVVVVVVVVVQVIKFSVWDQDADKDELIGQFVEKFQTVYALGKNAQYRWYNMYGAPVLTQGDWQQSIRKTALEMAREIEVASGKSRDYMQYYNTVPDKASAYKGRCLLKFHIESRRPTAYEEKLKGRGKSPLDMHPFLVKFPVSLPKTLEPATATYCLRVCYMTINPAFVISAEAILTTTFLPCTPALHPCLAGLGRLRLRAAGYPGGLDAGHRGDGPIRRPGAAHCSRGLHPAHTEGE